MHRRAAASRPRHDHGARPRSAARCRPRCGERIGVQHQEAQLQKRIKVWEAVDLWSSLYYRARRRRGRAARASRPRRKARRLVHDAVGRAEAAPVHRAGADPRAGAGVPRRADHGARSAGPPRHLGPRHGHPGPRHDGLPHDAPDGGSGAALRSRRDHRARPRRSRWGRRRELVRAALPRAHGRGLPTDAASAASASRHRRRRRCGEAGRLTRAREGDDFVTDVIHSSRERASACADSEPRCRRSRTCS